MRYRWLVTDLDGTLLDQFQQVPAVNRQALAAFRQAGGRVVLATGRMEAAVERYVRELAITEPCILYNGARVVDVAGGRVLWERRLPAAAAAYLLAQAEAWGDEVHPLVYTGDAVWVKRLTPALQAYQQKDGVTLRPVGSLRSLAGAPPIKMLIIGEPTRLSALAASLAVDGVRLVQSESHYLEVLPAGCSKGAALTWLAGHLGFSLDQVLAVGDHLNDREMLAVAGLGVAVGNAHPELARVAGAVVALAREGGVAEAITRFCLT